MKKKSLSLLFLFYFLFSIASTYSQIPPSNLRLRSKLNFAGGLANIYGYTARGREYALAGSNTGMEIIDITNPDAPKLIKHIPALQSLWREVKVYRDYAYVTTEAAGQGTQIVNLASLPDTNVVYKSISGPDSILTVISRSHSLHIDTAKGFLYLYGGITTYKDLGNTAGAVVMDIKTDPWNPKFVGRYTTNYIHDGYVENDTCWSAQINRGTLTVIDFRDKKNPITLGEVKTPLAFTHNTWLSTDHKTCFTTDEKPGSYLASYDVTDLTNIRLLDKVQSFSANTIVHNTHIRNDYAITSWYSDGVLIHDVHRPHNMVQIAQFDTYQCGGVPDFVGTWGAFPFFPSGNIVLSNLVSGDFFVLTPTYQRACYLEGKITDAVTGQPVTSVRVKINSDDADKKATSDDKGNFYTGQLTTGYFSVTFSKTGYQSIEKFYALNTAQVVTDSVALKPAKKITVSGKVLKNVSVRLSNNSDEYFTKTDSTGNFSISNVNSGSYRLQLDAWGSFFSDNNISIQNDTVLTKFSTAIDAKIIRDDFWSDLGWQVEGNTAAPGSWIRTNPKVSMGETGYLWRPAKTFSNCTNCSEDTYFYTTGEGNCIAGNNALVNNTTTLVSPSIASSFVKQIAATMNLNYWYTNRDTLTNQGGSLKIYARSGAAEQELFSVSTSQPKWRNAFINLGNIIPQADSFKIIIKATSTGDNFTVTAVDAVALLQLTPTIDIDNTFILEAEPNPFSSACMLNFDLGIGTQRAEIQVYNLVGQLVEKKSINLGATSADIGKDLPAGVYLAKIVTESKISRAVKLIKE